MNQQEEMLKRFDDIYLKIHKHEGDVEDILGYSDIKSFLQSEVNLALANRDKEIVEMIEKLPAFTPCSDKTMGKVSDEAKKPKWGTNYLERETLINLITKAIKE